jgi:hypothetical protein
VISLACCKSKVIIFGEPIIEQTNQTQHDFQEPHGHLELIRHQGKGCFQQLRP